MPELPEVETTVRGLKKKVLGLAIKDIWTDLDTKDIRKHDTVANSKFFEYFKKEVKNKKITSVERRAKNILVHLNNNKTILIHLKMTGHLLYGKYEFHPSEKRTDLKNSKESVLDGGIWIPKEDGPLKDPFNRFVHVVFVLDNGKHLVFSDTRKFGKVTLFETNEDNKHLRNIGPEPLEKHFTVQILEERLNKKQSGKIKSVLMDQSVIAGIGNIYSDEILWRAGVNPERKTASLTKIEISKIFKAIKELLKKGIDFGGDSMSDYRNINGERGKFQLHHQAYRRKGENCQKARCGGKIERRMINGRSAHFCTVHQK